MKSNAEENIQRFFFFSWLVFLFLAIGMSFYGSRFIGITEIELSVLLCILVNIIFIITMYALDLILQQTHGRISYIDWNAVEDKTPSTTISIIATFCFALIILIISTKIASGKSVDLLALSQF